MLLGKWKTALSVSIIYVFRTMKYKSLIIIAYVQIYLLKFKLVIYEKIAPICLVINKNLSFTTIAFYRLHYLLTAQPYTACLVHNPFICRSKMDFNQRPDQYQYTYQVSVYWYWYLLFQKYNEILMLQYSFCHQYFSKNV